MNMKPEIYEEWEEALSYLRNAEKLLADEKVQEAAKEIDTATAFGLHTIAILSKELGLPDLLAIQENAFYDWCERKPALDGKH